MAERRVVTQTPLETIAHVMERWLVGVLLVLAACGRVDPVTLKHPETGESVQCGPYTGLTDRSYAGGVLQQRGCIEDYRAQGYKRIPAR